MCRRYTMARARCVSTPASCSCSHLADMRLECTAPCIRVIPVWPRRDASTTDMIENTETLTLSARPAPLPPALQTTVQAVLRGHRWTVSGVDFHPAGQYCPGSLRRSRRCVVGRPRPFTRSLVHLSVRGFIRARDRPIRHRDVHSCTSGVMPGAIVKSAAAEGKGAGAECVRAGSC